MKSDGMSAIQSVSPQQALALQAQGALMLDVRTPAEWHTGVTPKALCLSLASLLNGDEEACQSLPADKNAPLMLVCETSQRSREAAGLLAQRGYRNLAVVSGGMAAWRTQDLPLEQPKVDEAALRYDRHLRLPQWGHSAQQKLGHAHVLMVGAGGLGSPAALYLAAAGVGHLTVVDDDTVELSNLQRQVLHSTETLGQPKVESAAGQLRALNPLVKLTTVEQRLTADSIDALLAGVDVVLDGSDNLQTRYLVNERCQQKGIPLVYAAVFQFEGQVASFDFRQPDSPCYACLFPPSQTAEPANCSQVGVLGVVPGVAGTLQASEAIKLITGIGESLSGHLLTFDLLENRFRRLTLKKDAHCAVCSKQTIGPQRQS